MYNVLVMVNMKVRIHNYVDYARILKIALSLSLSHTHTHTHTHTNTIHSVCIHMLQVNTLNFSVEQWSSHHMAPDTRWFTLGNNTVP